MSHENPELSDRAASAVVAALSARFGNPLEYEKRFEHRTFPGCFCILRTKDQSPLPLCTEAMEAAVRADHRLQAAFPGIKVSIQRIYVTGHLNIKLPKGEC
jgi:hypothetical protein